jgi:hypothetical protein
MCVFGIYELQPEETFIMQLVEQLNLYQNLNDVTC